VRHHRVVPRGEACGQRGCLRRPNSRAKHYVRIHVRPTPRVSENQPSPLPGFQPLKVVRRRCSRLQVYARHCLPGAKINQSEKSSRDAPAGGSGGVSALRHGRDRQRGEHCLVATKAPPTPPQRWRARSKGVKQISMTICTTASTGVHSLCSRATSDPVAFRTKREIRRSSHSSV
jgi:hypothetical protein